MWKSSLVAGLGWLSVGLKQLLTAGCLLCFRGSRVHQGLDVVCSDGSVVYAPFDVTLHGKVIVYNDPTKAAINSGINLRGEGRSSRMYHIKPCYWSSYWSSYWSCVLQICVSSCSTFSQIKPLDQWGRGRGSAPCCPCRMFTQESPHTSTSRWTTGATPRRTSDGLTRTSVTLLLF